MSDLLLNIFANDAFSLVEMTESFNEVPNEFGTMRRMNVFPDKPIRTKNAVIEIKTWSNNLLPNVAWGGPASVGSGPSRRDVIIDIPHFPHEDSVAAQDVIGVRAFGSTNMFEGVQDLINEKLMIMGKKHDITREFMSWGAIKGQVLNAAGDVLFDFFDAFQKTPVEMSFDLNNSAAEVLLKIMALKRTIELNNEGSPPTTIWVPCSPTFFEKLITHASVKDAYKYYASQQSPLRDDNRGGFYHAGVLFTEENGYADNFAGVRRKFIADDTAQVVPIGTDAAGTFLAPADFIETVNTPGLPRYAKQKLMDFGRGVVIHTQSNVLPYFKRPQMLIKLTM